ELWKSDGTPDGTLLVKDIQPGSASSSPASLTNVNGTLFFTAFDPAVGTEVWKSDGTAAGTALVKDIRPGASSSSPTALADVDGRLFFSANDGEVAALWASDGTAAGTTQVLTLRRLVGERTAGSDPASLSDVNGRLYFAATEPSIGR